MKKLTRIIVPLFAATLLTSALAGCSNGTSTSSVPSPTSGEPTSATSGEPTSATSGSSSTSQTSGSSSTSSSQPETDYIVKVYTKTGIKASADKQRAKKGEIVTITIEEISSGYTLKSVMMNEKVLSADSSNPMIYKFEMPNQSASITFLLNVQGYVIIDGDISGTLNLNEETGVYEARNFLAVSDPKTDALFNVKVGDTKISALDLDESRSFGDFGITTSKDYVFTIRTHNYYDFFYDPNAEIPFSIQRVGVDTLPSTVDELSSLLITGYAVRSEPAIYSGVSSMNVNIINNDGSDNEDFIKQNYIWNKFKDNKSFASVSDVDLMEEERTMYVYKDLDVENKVLTVVDTYEKKNGALTANDDPYRENYNKYGAYSAKYNIISGDDYDYQRFSRNLSHATRTLNVSAHMPAYYIEREIMDAYRVGYEGSDEKSFDERKIVPTRNDDNSFSVALDTKVEYKLVSSSGSDASVAYVFDVDMNFDVRGALTKLEYKKYLYNLEKWDFIKHEPLKGKTPVLKKKIIATYGYETPTSSFDPTLFDITPYFISSIDSIRIYNPLTGKPSDDGKSYVQLDDNLELFNGDFLLNDYTKVSYSPETAIDLWQYGPTESSDETVIRKMPNDLYYQMSAIKEGDANVTFSNHQKGAAGGATFTLPVNVSTKTLIRGFYLYDVDEPYISITDATPVNVKAGTIHSYEVVRYPSSAPLKYTAVSSNNDLCKVTTEPNAEIMTLDFSSAIGVKETTKVTITLESDKYDPSFGGGKPTVFTFYIIPNDIDPTGIWGMDGAESTTFIIFTDEIIDQTTQEKKGTIHDEISSSQYYDAEFAYYFDGISLTARITKIKVVSSDSWSSNPEDYILVFEYHPEISGGRYGVGLEEYVYDEYYESFVGSALLGEVNDDGEFINLDSFRKL